jgi:hypothetical protein
MAHHRFLILDFVEGLHSICGHGNWLDCTGSDLTAPESIYIGINQKSVNLKTWASNKGR